MQQQIHRRPWNDGRELLHEFDGIEAKVRRAITPGAGLTRFTGGDHV
jgi:hypothetical protein